MVRFMSFLDLRRTCFGTSQFMFFVAFDDTEPKKNDSGHLKSSVILEPLDS